MTVMTRTHIAAVVMALLAGASAAGAQSLADAARKEEERRQTVKTPAKTLTNKDLPTVPPPTAVVPASGSVSGADAGAQPGEVAEAAPADKDGAAEEKDGADSNAGDTTDEAYWSGRMAKARETLQRDRTLAEAMQSRINALTTDFVNRGDPQQQAQIGLQRQTALDELARLKKAIEDGEKAILDLQEEARRAGVPAGWLR